MRKNYMNLGRKNWTRNERRLGRMIRDGEGHPGGDQGGNNGGGTPGNSGDSGSGGSNQNNTGSDFDASSFWDGPPADKSGAPNGESATQRNPPAGDQGNQGGGFAEQLNTQLSGLSFGEPVITAEIAEQINQGNFDGFQKNINGAMQSAVRHALAMNVQILRPFAEQLMEQMREEMGSTLNNRDNQDSLVKDFPAAADPKVAPVIRGVFDQALKNTKGDRAAAVKQTKEMMALLANTTAGDLNLNVAPRGPDDSGRPTNTVTNWLDELTSR